MPVFNMTINGRSMAVDVAPSTPLLWVLRDHLGLTGTKFGCGLGVCGSCTVHVDGDPQRACQLPISALGTGKVLTIEGLGGNHPVQQAWLEEDVAQCGYCQPGQIMQAAWLLGKHPKPTDAQINAAMAENICRCGTYQRIRCAILKAAGQACGGAK